MASTFSTNLALELIGTGDQAGSWGNTTNTNLGTLIEQAISGYVTQGVTTGNTTSITIPDGATGVARNMFIELTGTGGTNTVLAVPANKKLYFIYNNTSGAVTVKVGAGTGVSVAATEKKILVSNGTDIVEATSYLTAVGGSLTLTTLTATSATITNLTSTSLTLSNNPTLSGGTANGVLYLNGSKVATSGSALTFDGTNLSNTGAAPSIRSTFTGGAYYTSLNADGVYASGTDLYLVAPASKFVSFYANNAEGMRLTSTGLGIGTASPSAKIHAVSAVGADAGSFSDGSTYTLAIRRAGSTGNVGLLTGTAGSALAFGTNNVEVARFDSSGALGIGTTSPGSKLDIVGSARAIGTINSSFGAYATNNTSSLFKFGNSAGTDHWAIYETIGASGQQGSLKIYDYTIAGDRVTLDTSGNLGIGTSSPTQRLQVNGSSAAILITGVTNTSGMQLGVREDGNDVQVLNVANAALRFGTNATERARITATGNLLVGTTTDVASRSGTISDISGNVRAIPRVGSAKTAVYTLSISDVGQYVELGTGGAIDVPNAIFSTGDVVSVFNNTTGARTISLTITTAYLAGTDADKASVSLATRGVATILFISNSVCVVSGNVS